MDVDFQSVLLIVTSVVTGASIILRAIAPLTKNKFDDKVSSFLISMLKFLSLNTSSK